MKKNDSKKSRENQVIMEEKKIKWLKIKDTTEDENEIKAFIIIIAVIAILVGAIYGLTELLKKDEVAADNTSIGEINYDIVSVGTLLNRPYDEYYVLVYNSDDSKAMLYTALLNRYIQNTNDKDYVKIYHCDLKNKLNSNYYNVNNDNKSNANVTKTEEFDFSDLTLIKVNNGKITKYIEKYEKIKEILV